MKQTSKKAKMPAKNNGVKSIVSSSSVFINDRYSHLKFKTMATPTQLTIGMMVQICESNKQPLSWEWNEITVELLNKLLVMPSDKYKWIRIPSYCC